MIENRNIVVIPFYKAHPSPDERESLRQCAKTLQNHLLFLVCPKKLQVDEYALILDKYNCKYITEYFGPEYFNSVVGYNQLMLSTEFYRRFSDYEYMLIYQLDAWVFRDELDYWSHQGFDYIGAPWVKKDEQKGVIQFDGVGNGGFSLRRIQHFIDVLSHHGPVRNGDNLHLKPSIKNRIYKFLYKLGYQNNIEYYKKNPTLYEDIFLSLFLSDSKLSAKTPDPLTASRFAFEKEPAHLFSLNNNQLPFGCHAWRKYEYDTFWFKNINVKS